MPIYEIIMSARVELSGRFVAQDMASLIDVAKKELLLGEISDVEVERVIELNEDEDPDYFVAPV